MVIRAVTQKSDTPQSPKASWNHQNKDSQRKRNTDMTETTFSTHLVQSFYQSLCEKEIGKDIYCFSFFCTSGFYGLFHSVGTIILNKRAHHPQQVLRSRPRHICHR